MLVQMFPLILALIPLFIIFKDAGLINTYYSVILVYTLLNLPFATWMFEGFFDAIPRELEEAASVDGCTRFGTLTRIVVPLSGPGTAAVTIFTETSASGSHAVSTAVEERGVPSLGQGVGFPLA